MSLTSQGGTLTTGLWIGDSPLILLKSGKKYSGFDPKRAESSAQWIGHVTGRGLFVCFSQSLGVNNKELDFVRKSPSVTSHFLAEHTICKTGSILKGDEDTYSSLKPAQPLGWNTLAFCSSTHLSSGHGWCFRNTLAFRLSLFPGSKGFPVQHLGIPAGTGEAYLSQGTSKIHTTGTANIGHR